MAKVFILDDDKMLCEMLCRHLNLLNHQTSVSHTINEGIPLINTWQPDVVFLDVQLPDGNGLHSISEIRKIHSKPEIIIITGQGDPDGAELAINNGAWDYIEKPSSISQMTLPLLRVLEYRKEREKFKPKQVLRREGIIGSSQRMIDCLEQVANAANSSASVLITGETGTGKEVFANAIHTNSKRADSEMIIVDCAALPDNLVESILFGHEKGAFTGASSSNEGLVKQADRGTLFLDEVGELPLAIQKTFLRVLQEQKYRPVGSKKEVTSNFRLIAATNRNLRDMVKQKQFREDLLFRLQGIIIELPPLRERREDIQDLVVHNISKICTREQTTIKGMTPEFLRVLEIYDWPGNVREMVNSLESAIGQSQDDQTLFINHLPKSIRISAAKNRLTGTKRENTPPKTSELSEKHTSDTVVPTEIKPFSIYRDEELSKMEKRYLENLFAVSNNKISEAIQLSQLSRSRLYAIMKKHSFQMKS